VGESVLLCSAVPAILKPAACAARYAAGGHGVPKRLLWLAALGLQLLRDRFDEIGILGTAVLLTATTGPRCLKRGGAARTVSPAEGAQ
jgi:hypothetical protein